MMKKPLRLNSTIGRHDVVEPEDVLAMKTALNWTGFYEIPEYGLTSTPDEPMFDGIEKFQKENSLSVDGIVRPEGETVEAMNLSIHRNEKSDEIKPPPKPQCSEGEQPILQGFCLPGTKICVHWWECKKIPPYEGTLPRG